ncbi:VOC family protein [Massilia sp. 2TAF26]
MPAGGARQRRRHRPCPADPGRRHDHARFGSVSSEGEYGRLLAQPDEIGGRETQTVYLRVQDADRVCERARDAGATILQEPADTEFGSRGFLCRDREGHVWNVGTYDPWQAGALFDKP